MSRPQSRSDVPWSKRREIPDRQITDAADQYADACQLLLAQQNGVLLPLINSAAHSIELYLKSLSAERIYMMDITMPEASKVTAYPSVVDHRFKPLFNAIPDDVRMMLIKAYDAKLRFELNEDFLVALERFDGAFSASRYPFEPNVSVREYDLQSLVYMVKFLREFVHSLPPREQIIS